MIIAKMSIFNAVNRSTNVTGHSLHGLVLSLKHTTDFTERAPLFESFQNMPYYKRNMF